MAHLLHQGSEQPPWFEVSLREDLVEGMVALVPIAGDLREVSASGVHKTPLEFFDAVLIYEGRRRLGDAPMGTERSSGSSTVSTASPTGRRVPGRAAPGSRSERYSVPTCACMAGGAGGRAAEEPGPRRRQLLYTYQMVTRGWNGPSSCCPTWTRS